VLVDYLVTSETRKKLLLLLLTENYKTSIRTFASLIGASYAVTYEELREMERVELVECQKKGRASIYGLNTANEQVALLARLFKVGLKQREASEIADEDTVVSLARHGAPLVIEKDFSEVLTVEETIALGVKLSKKSGLVFRTLPIVIYRNRENINWPKLRYFSEKYEVKKHLGFLLEMTGAMGKQDSLKRQSRAFWDSRNKKTYPYFDQVLSSNVELQLAELATPKIGRKWCFTMNMSQESLQRYFDKHTGEK
jgi:hypothetical protein